MNQLIHYSRAPLQSVRSVKQLPKPGNKPRGFWVTVPDGTGDVTWPEWCRAEEFLLENLTHATAIELQASAKILAIGTVANLDAFGTAYGIWSFGAFRHIRWDAVARLYDGILITPYQCMRRMYGEQSWYYSWDCASGCIWNANAIAGIEAIRLEQVAA